MTAIEQGRALVGVPWVHQGRDPKTGLDCIGFLCQVLQEPHEARYSRDPHGLTLERELEARFGAPVAEPRAGDVVSMRWGGDARHVALVADHPQGGLSIIHASNSVGCVTEHRLDAKWRRRIVAAYRP